MARITDGEVQDPATACLIIVTISDLNRFMYFRIEFPVARNKSEITIVS